MAYGVSNGDMTDDVTSLDPQMCCEAVRSAILATAWLLVTHFTVLLYICCHVLKLSSPK